MACGKHVEELAPKLRASDVRDLAAQLDIEARAALEASCRQSSSSWTVCGSNGEAIAMFDVVPSSRQTFAGRAWFVASPAIYEFRRQWIRLSNVSLSTLFDEFEVLFNVMDDRNKTERRWVEWMGFEFLSLDPSFGPQRDLSGYLPSVGIKPVGKSISSCFIKSVMQNERAFSCWRSKMRRKVDVLRH